MSIIAECIREIVVKQCTKSRCIYCCDCMNCKRTDNDGSCRYFRMDAELVAAGLGEEELYAVKALNERLNEVNKRR